MKRKADLLLIAIFVLLFLTLYISFKIVTYNPPEPNVIQIEAVKEEVENPIKEVNLIIIENSVSVNEVEVKEKLPRLEYTDEDVELMAKVIMSECGHCSYECKVAVAETIVNRVLNEQFPNSVYKVVHQPNQYYIANVVPNEECYEAAKSALMDNQYPDTMVWFRNSYPHSYGDYYIRIDGLYFNTINVVDK